MATCIYSQLYSYILSILILLSTLNSSTCIDGEVHEADQYHKVELQSFFPSENCNNSQDFTETEKSKLKIVVQSGPCSPINHNEEHTQENILKNDQIRVKWLQYETSNNSNSLIEASEILATKGTAQSTANYVVQIGLGTPKINQTVQFDTGSDLTWVQCQPCRGHCYKQQDQIFNPSNSSTYTNISCSSQYCTSLNDAYCWGSACIYNILYGDRSTTLGFFAKDTLTLGPSEVFQDFRFGCGQDNKGIYGKTAGLMGLGRNPSSVVLQTMEKYGGVFAYCLPALSNEAGYLTFGNSSLKPNMGYTPMLSMMRRPSFYSVELISISVGGKELDVPPSVFSTAGAIIDSGTVITRMPPTAYSALRAEFRSRMSKYPSAPRVDGILDTCYDLSNFTTAHIPDVALNFRGVVMDLDPSGIIYTLSNSQVCLAFAPNADDDAKMIIGNTQQRRFNVVYDVVNKMIGFSPRAC